MYLFCSKDNGNNCVTLLYTYVVMYVDLDNYACAFL